MHDRLLLGRVLPRGRVGAIHHLHLVLRADAQTAVPQHAEVAVGVDDESLVEAWGVAGMAAVHAEYGAGVLVAKRVDARGRELVANLSSVSDCLVRGDELACIKHIVSLQEDRLLELGISLHTPGSNVSRNHLNGLHLSVSRTILRCSRSPYSMLVRLGRRPRNTSAYSSIHTLASRTEFYKAVNGEENKQLCPKARTRTMEHNKEMKGSY